MALLGRIVDRYILREIVTSWLLVTSVLLVVLMTNEMARVLSRAADNQYPRDVVLALIGLGTLNNLDIVVPVGLLLGVVLAFGRLYHDSEMAALQACGIGTRRIYLPVMSLALVVTGLLAWVSLYLAPDSMARILNLRSVAFRAGQFAPVVPGRFRTFAGGSTVVYAEGGSPDGLLTNVFVQRSRGGHVEVALADRARHRMDPDAHSLTITLYDGERVEGIPGSPQFRIMHFAEEVIPVQIPPPSDTVSDLSAVSTGALERTGSLASRAELQWRIALPIMCVALTLIAVPLSRLRPRQGRYARVWLAVLLYLVYSNLIAAGRVWIQRGTLPPSIGLWWTHVLVIAVAWFLLGAPRWTLRLLHRERMGAPV